MRTILLALAFVFVVVNAGSLLHMDNPERIPNEYIVLFNEDVTDAEVKLHYTNVTSHYLWVGQTEIRSRWAFEKFHGYHVYTPDTRVVDLILSHPEIYSVEPNAMVYKSACQTQTAAPWGLARIDITDIAAEKASYYYPTFTTNQVNAYIIDTGIHIQHTDFGGRAIYGKSFIAGVTNPIDDNGHGTHVAGTVGGTKYGVAKFATLIAVKVLSGSGSGTNAGVIDGINWCATDSKTRKGTSIANLSLGGGASTATDTAMRNLVNAGVATAVAAGNENQNACNVSPARAAEVLTVGATDSSDILASFSNWGTCVDCLAPGVSIASAWHTSTTATNTISGTSMASPHVAGVLCLYAAAHPTVKGHALQELLKKDLKKPVISNLRGTTNHFVYTGGLC